MDTCSHLEVSHLCEEHHMDGCFCPEGACAAGAADAAVGALPRFPGMMASLPWAWVPSCMEGRGDMEGTGGTEGTQGHRGERGAWRGQG